VLSLVTVNDPRTTDAAPDPPAPENLGLPGADLWLYRDTGLGGDARLRQLVAGTPWRQDDITVFGTTCPQPRLVAWYGDPGTRYAYSGIAHEPLAWTAGLTALRRAVESICHSDFNSVLLNYYRDGADAMGLHADDEPELGPWPRIASLSIGATRRMYFRHRSRRDLASRSLDLTDGSLLLMAGATQANWKHGIRRTRKPCGPRINLSFRFIAGSG